jgi:hypothetical protein
MRDLNANDATPALLRRARGDCAPGWATYTTEDYLPFGSGAAVRLPVIRRTV